MNPSLVGAIGAMISTEPRARLTGYRTETGGNPFARRCPEGHANPTHNTKCLRCKKPMPRKRGAAARKTGSYGTPRH